MTTDFSQYMDIPTISGKTCTRLLKKCGTAPPIHACLKQLEKLGWQMKVTCKTFKPSLPDLLNAAKYNQSNSYLERINRKIKQIERKALSLPQFLSFSSCIKLEKLKFTVKKASSYLVS